jgi:hypothetical protein
MRSSGFVGDKLVVVGRYQSEVNNHKINQREHLKHEKGPNCVLFLSSTPEKEPYSKQGIYRCTNNYLQIVLALFIRTKQFQLQALSLHRLMVLILALDRALSCTRAC